MKNNGKIILTTPNFSIFFQTIQRISKLLGIKDYSEVTVSKFDTRKLKKLLEQKAPTIPTLLLVAASIVRRRAKKNSIR